MGTVGAEVAPGVGSSSSGSIAGKAAAEWKRQRLEFARRRESAMARAVALVSSGERTDTAAFNAAMAGCRAVGRPAQALGLWERMRASGTRPDRQSYEHALVCAMATRRHGLALRVWEAAHADTSAGGAPSALEYTAAMSAYERTGAPERALQVFDSMAHANVAPDSNTLHVAASAASRARLVRLPSARYAFAHALRARARASRLPHTGVAASRREPRAAARRRRERPPRVALSARPLCRTAGACLGSALAH